MSASNDLYRHICTELVNVCESAFSVSFSGYSIKYNVANRSAPITYRSSKEIILNCDLSCAGSIAFQLSHELCHASIADDVPRNLRWLEETFAVLASYVFPRKLDCIDPCKYGVFYCRSFKREEAHFQMSPRPLEVHDLEELESGSGTPNFNDYKNYYKVTKILLPIAREYPDIWKVVPHLCEIPSGFPLSASLDFLSGLVPSDIRDVLDVIKGSSLVP